MNVEVLDDYEEDNYKNCEKDSALYKLRMINRGFMVGPQIKVLKITKQNVDEYITIDEVKTIFESIKTKYGAKSFAMYLRVNTDSNSEKIEGFIVKDFKSWNLNLEMNMSGYYDTLREYQLTPSEFAYTELYVSIDNYEAQHFFRFQEVEDLRNERLNKAKEQRKLTEEEINSSLENI